MPTRTPDQHPFQRGSPPTREQLLAYIDGRLSPEEQHAVEEHLESDPLLREAVEGLQLPGARASLDRLDGMRPVRNGHHTTWWIIGAAAVIIAVVGTTWYFNRGTEVDLVTEMVSHVPEKSSAIVANNTPIGSEEITAATEKPAGDLIGHERMALHTREASRLVIPREQGATRIDPRPFGLPQEADSARLRQHRRERSSVQLLFLHDLKVVDPRELYGNEPQLDIDEVHVAARFADATLRDSLRAENIYVGYTAFMDAALGRFSGNDHKGCLDDLRYLLDQYPDDVNALFYAGLCAYNVGLHERARVLLQRAAVHSVDVFNEEAAWYHALTLDRLGDPAANESFKRIAESDGFYSELAKNRVATH